MFVWDNGLKLTRADLAVDIRRRQPRAFVSHAHSDHIARHEYALCTPATSALYQFRLGPRRTLEMPYRRPIEWGGLRLTTYPAGHCLGSAMLLAEDGRRSLLYTGDFKLGESATAERAELPRADLLVIESTYGHPSYRLPPREEAIGRLVEEVRRALEADATPVVEAYTLGKAQEVSRILTDHGLAVLQHGKVYEITQIYRRFGVEFGRLDVWHGRPEPGTVLVVPPRTRRLEDTAREVRFAVTGWAIDEGAKHRLRVDHAIPLSDHADYDDLFRAIDLVSPQTIYCTHGPPQFVDRLRDAGHNAHPLGRPSQGRLF